MNRRKILGPADRPIGIYSNPLKDINHAAAFKFIEYLKAIGMKAVFAREAGDTGFPCPVGIETVSLEKLFGISGLIVVFGGDGTMLRAINGAAPLKIPVLGVNMGNVGFLTETDAGGLEAAAKALKDGRFEIDERSMLEIRVSRGAADLSAAAYLALKNRPRSCFDRRLSGMRVFRGRRASGDAYWLYRLFAFCRRPHFGSRRQRAYNNALESPCSALPLLCRFG